MLNRLFRKYRVSEVHLCLPFVQITMEKMAEETTIVPPTASVPAPPDPPSPLQERCAAPSDVVRLAVRERPAAGEIAVVPVSDELYTDLAFRVASQVDHFGPVFPPEWRPLSSGPELRPGDYLWVRLYCRNRSERVLHHVRIAFEGMEIARKQAGMLVRGVNGWPRIPVRDCFAGQEVRHLNPGDDYSLHCVLRVPPDIFARPASAFSGVRLDFTILKQMH
ncbi:MAG: hypothetical protein SFU56_12195 [Capsulimonadales bacterium]|nr:hypothetical protein [Capsulimonadales bacterium]